MSTVSKNSFDLIKIAGQKVKGKFFKALGATILTIAPLLLCVFGLYTAPIAALLFGVFETGYIRYIRALMNDENPSFKLIFSEFKNPWLEIFLGAILVCMFIGGAVLLLVPAIIFISFYSMSLYFAEYNKSKMPFDAMYDSNKHMKGNYINMFSYKSLFWLMYAILIIGGLAGVFGAFKLWANYKLWSVVLFIGTYLVITVLWSIVSIYYKASSELFFQELLVYNSKKETVKEVEIIEEAQADTEVPVVEKKVVKAKPATKSSAEKTTKAPTKSTSKSSTTAVKKASTIKTTTKKSTTNKK